ncbi:hypothetical protein Franean1_2951 [Parafrankia sp. EAN1pec]|nr:hypothetical protein Franean1_2951 [Frankia sp. EAN1pec]
MASLYDGANRRWIDYCQKAAPDRAVERCPGPRCLRCQPAARLGPVRCGGRTRSDSSRGSTHARGRLSPHKRRGRPLAGSSGDATPRSPRDVPPRECAASGRAWRSVHQRSTCQGRYCASRPTSKTICQICVEVDPIRHRSSPFGCGKMGRYVASGRNRLISSSRVSILDGEGPARFDGTAGQVQAIPDRGGPVSGGITVSWAAGTMRPGKPTSQRALGATVPCLRGQC